MGAAPLAAAAAQTAHAAGPSGAKPVYKLADVKETTNICCYCSGGCGTICSARNGELINLEGDPDHPVNMGGLCPKGAAMWGLRNIVTPERKAKLHPDRVLTPLVRRPGSKTWEKISWDEAIDAIAKERGIDLVLRGEGIAYTIPELDISSEVITRVSAANKAK